MKRKIVNGFLMMALVTSSMGSFVSCKDYEEDNLVEMRGKIENVNQALQAQITSLQTTVNDLTTAKTQCEAKLAALQSDLANYLTVKAAEDNYMKISDYAYRISNNEAAIALLQDAITSINQQIGDITAEKFTEINEKINDVNIVASNAQAVADQALALAQANGADIAELKAAAETLQTTIVAWTEQLETAAYNANYALTLAKADSVRIDAIEGLYTSLTAADEAMGTRIDALTAEITTLKADYQAALTAAKEEAKAYTDQVNQLATNAMTQANSALAAANAADVKVEELKKALENYMSAEEVKAEIASITSNISDVTGQVEQVQTALDSFKEDLKAMITSIEIQGSESPVTGYLSLPIGVRTNILAAYYGETSSNGLEFPTELPRYYVNASQVFTDRNFDVMGINDFTEIPGYTYIQPNTRFVGVKNGSTTGNAGKVYVTINPSNVDFSYKTLDLETSQMAASPVKLSPLKPSDKELTFGYTRATGNGFYEADATLSVDDIDNATIKIALGDIKDIATSIVNTRTKSSVLEAGLNVLEMASDILPAYGLKASWQDKTNGDVHNLYSKYELATTAIKPLSFAFLKDLHVETVPGFERIQDLVAEIIRQIKIKIPAIPETEITFGSINLLEPGKLAVDVVVGEKDINATSSFTINGGYVYDNYGNIVGHYDAITQTITIHTTVDLGVNIHEDFTDDINALITEINNKYTNPDYEGSIAEQIADLMNSVLEFNKMGQYIDDAKENMIDGINKYITRANNALCRIINSANRTLQTALVAKQADGKMALLARSKSLATKCSGELTLIPTTYTLELFAPAYKKFIAVTDVYDANGNQLPLAEAQAKAKAANAGENMMKVIDGNTTLTFNGEQGFVYQIAYAAVDYDSQVTVRRFYVRF